MDKIETAELGYSETEAKMSAPDVYAQGSEVAASLASELDEARQKIEKMTLRWEELESRRGE